MMCPFYFGLFIISYYIIKNNFNTVMSTTEQTKRGVYKNFITGVSNCVFIIGTRFSNSSKHSQST